MYRFFILFAVVLALTAQDRRTRTGPPAAAGGPPGGRAGSDRTVAADAKPGAVRGTVVGASNEPLRKAEVVLRGGRGSGGTWVQTTEASGSFTFENVPPGNYSLSVQRNGYVRSEYGGRPGSRSGSALSVGSGQDVTGVTVKLTPHSVIAGKVVDEDGDPVLHASVQILRDRWINGRRQSVPMNADSTNDLGEYRVSGLAPGRYYIMASVSNPRMERSLERSRTQNPETSYAPLYYPGVNDLSQASAVTLTPGQQMLGVDLQLRKVPVFRIRGRVLDENGKAAPYVSVMALPSEGFAGPRPMGVVRNDEGTFEIPDVPPGSYTLVANRMSREQRTRMSAQTPVLVGNRDLDNVVLHLARAFEVTGTVRIAAEGVALGSTRVTLEPLQSGGPFFGSSESEMKPDGTFSVDGVSPGKYRVSVQNLPQGTYVKSVLVQGQDITAGASITAAASGIEVNLAANAPEVTGTVLNADKQPVPNVYVVLVPEISKQEQYWLYRVTTADQSGAFTFRNITPGQYTAYAFNDVEEGSWFSPEFVKQFDGRGTTLKLAESSKETVQLTPAQ